MGRTSAALLAPLLLATACGTLTLREEEQLGRQFEEQMRRELHFVHDRTVNGYVREVGREILRAAGPQPFEYRFYVIHDENINAFAGPGGRIYVHTETILRARDASELAGVLAHEIGHVVERHVAENYNRGKGTQVGRQLLVLGAAVVGGGAAAQAAALGTGLAGMAYLNSFGREAENEADGFAVRAMVGSGWDPEGLVTFFEVLLAEGGPHVPKFLSSHPATEDRIANTRAEIAKYDAPRGLARDDGGKFEIIQRRIELLTGRRRYR